MAIIDIIAYPQIYCFKKQTIDDILDELEPRDYGDWVGIIGNSLQRYELNPFNIPLDATGITLASGVNYVNPSSFSLTVSNIMSWLENVSNISSFNSYSKGALTIPFLKIAADIPIRGDDSYLIPYYPTSSSSPNDINIAIRVRYVIVVSYKETPSSTPEKMAFPSSNSNPFMTILNAHKIFDNTISGNQVNDIKIIDYEGNIVEQSIIDGTYHLSILPYYIVSTLYGYGQNNDIRMDGWETFLNDDEPPTELKNMDSLSYEILEAVGSLGVNDINKWDLVNQNLTAIYPIGDKYLSPQNVYKQHKVYEVNEWSITLERNLIMQAINETTNEYRYISNVPTICIAETPQEDYAKFIVPSALSWGNTVSSGKVKAELFSVLSNSLTNIKRRVTADFIYKGTNNQWYSTNNPVSSIDNVTIPDKAGNVTYTDNIGSFSVSDLGVSALAGAPIIGTLYIEYTCMINGTSSTITSDKTIPFGFNLGQINAQISAAQVSLTDEFIDSISIQLEFTGSVNDLNYAPNLSFDMKNNSIKINYLNPNMIDSVLSINPITLSNPINEANIKYKFIMEDIKNNILTKTYSGTHELRVSLYDINGNTKDVIGSIEIEVPDEIKVIPEKTVEFDDSAEFDVSGNYI